MTKEASISTGLMFLITFLKIKKKMAEQEKLGRFSVGLAVEITNNVTRGLQNACQSFTNQLLGLLTVISVQ